MHGRCSDNAAFEAWAEEHAIVRPSLTPTRARFRAAVGSNYWQRGPLKMACPSRDTYRHAVCAMQHAAYVDALCEVLPPRWALPQMNWDDEDESEPAAYEVWWGYEAAQFGFDARMRDLLHECGVCPTSGQACDLRKAEDARGAVAAFAMYSWLICGTAWNLFVYSEAGDRITLCHEGDVHVDTVEPETYTRAIALAQRHGLSVREGADLCA